MNCKIIYRVGIIMIILLSLVFLFLFNYDIFIVNLRTNLENIFIENYKSNDNYVFLGDSLTELYFLDEYYENLPLINSGQGGNTTNDILDNLYDRLYKYNPTKVFLLIGINDMSKNIDNDIIYNNIIKIVREIQKNRPDAKIYIESLYPINDSDDEKISRKSVEIRKNYKITYINDKLKKYCNENNLTYIDVNKELLDNNNMLKLEYTVDGVHLTSLAYLKITSILLPYLNES